MNFGNRFPTLNPRKIAPFKPRSLNEEIRVRGSIISVLENVKTGKKRVYESKNLVGDAGDTYYAQKLYDATQTNTFNTHEYGTAGAAPVKTSNRSAITAFVAGSQKVVDATYPRSNDPDTDNTGSGVDIVTHMFSYTTAEANSAGINRGIITNPTPGATEPVLTYYTITAFEKTSSDTLKQFINHTILGV